MAKPQDSDKLSLKDAVCKLKEVELELKELLVNLHESLEIWSTEPQFQTSLEVLKQNAQSRASDLEAEVKQLREELESIKDVLGFNLKK
ncbi:MAG: hypothetical protein NWE92_01035 [Candidatus Bathyarchaeota archaeon]|nr:hypothetical protein [Candidatus Bathyarchaeota archaeon]